MGKIVGLTIVVNLVLTFILVSPINLLSVRAGFLLGTMKLSDIVIFLLYGLEWIILTLGIYYYYSLHNQPVSKKNALRFAVVFPVVGFLMIVPFISMVMYFGAGSTNGPMVEIPTNTTLLLTPSFEH